MTPYKLIIASLRKGDDSCLTLEVIAQINNITVQLLNKSEWDEYEKEVVKDILHISNIIYNNTDRNTLVLEDGVYDLLIQKYKRYDEHYQVGAEPIHFNAIGEKGDTNNIPEMRINPFMVINIDKPGMLFYDTFFGDLGLMANVEMPKDDVKSISKRMRVVSHNYPELVGTLDKCKFVLNSEAREKDCFDRDDIVIFERDFLRKHVEQGIINPNDITLVLELKYDGISVEADVTDRVLSARTRGDTGLDKASDLTPLLGGYPFDKASGYDIKQFGMKFEAIILNRNMEALEQMGIKYVHPRNAVIGLTSRADGNMYADKITLVPLATSLSNKMNRIEEIEFINKYYATGCKLVYAVVRGDYNTVLFNVYRFVKEAEMVRDYMPFRYDGVVVSYFEPSIRKELGRKNNVNQYSIAIKFNPKVKYTTFLGYDYTVGQNGTITPMIYFNPVEFAGAIQNHCTGYSYARFKELGLRVGDSIRIDYNNDIMAYVSKPNLKENMYNPNPIVPFITNCPECGSLLQVSDSEDSVKCPNFNCPGRSKARLVNMVAKLGFKGFKEASLKALNVHSLREFLELDAETIIRSLGEKNGDKLIESLNKFHSTQILDYMIVGSLGFSNLAYKKWRDIFRLISIDELVELDDFALRVKLSAIKGNGNSNKGTKTATINTIMNERKMFMEDLKYIKSLNNIVYTGKEYVDQGKSMTVIRFSGVRDYGLIRYLNNKGYDAGEGSVTRRTNYLIVPYNGFMSGKVQQAIDYNLKYESGIQIVPIDVARNNPDMF